MSLESTLTDVTNRLRQGRYPNEQAISQGIVLRLLQDLGWDTWDPAIVWPEYQTGEGRVDFALCVPPLKPAVFIEVKQPGRADDGVRQALEYAFHTGVPFVVLTDGKTWSFYLPAEQGSYEERRVHKLDLFERPAAAVATVLGQYILRPRVEAGEALEHARTEYRSRNRRAQARAAIPDAWRELIDKGDEQIVQLLADVVESKTGTRPEDDDVAEYLATLGSTKPYRALTTFPAPPPRPSVETAPGHRRPSSRASESLRSGTLVLLGKTYEYSNAKEAMLTVLRELALREASFLERCAQHPDAQGRKRRYIARTPEAPYPDRPDLHGYHAVLPGGWVAATNLNNVLKVTLIRLAADVAGLVFGEDIVVDL